MRLLPLSLCLAAVAACEAPPLEAGPAAIDLAETSDALGVTCVGSQECTGGGTVYTSAYRVGRTPSGSSELLQTFKWTSAKAPARVSVVARSLRTFTATVPPQLHVRVYGPITSRVEDLNLAALSPVLEGSVALSSLARNAPTGITLEAANGFVASAFSDATFVLGFSVDGVGADGTGSTLVGLGAIVQSNYADGLAYVSSRRSGTPWGALSPSRWRPAGPYDLAFAMSGDAGTPCAAADECSAGLVCHRGACFAPNAEALGISPASVTVGTGSVTTFLSTGGNAPFTFVVASGGGSISGAQYTAPASAGSAVVRVTDDLGASAQASVTVVAATIQGACTGLPGNAAWNTASEITQTWTGAAYEPSTAGVYSATGSTTSCVFGCLPSFTWSAGACVPAAPTAPPVTSGLAAHFNARVAGSITKNGSNVVSAWADLSGASRNLAVNAAAPVYSASLINGRPALDFSGSAGLVTGAFPLTTSVTVFAVVQWRTPGVWGSIAHHGNRDSDWALEQNGLDATNVTHWQSVNDNAGLELTLSPGTNYALAGRISGANRLYSATTSSTVTTTGTGNTISAGSKALYLGRSDASEGSNVYFGEFLYYARALTDLERDQVLAYLVNAWGLAPQAAPAGLVHCWGGEGNGLDAIGANHASVQSNVTYSSGLSGSAFECGAGAGSFTTNAYTTARPGVSATGPWTYEFWIRRDSATVNAWVFDRNFQSFSGTGSPLVNLHSTTDGTSYWYVRNDAGVAQQTPSFNLPSGQWHHVAVVRTGGQLSSYLDGVALGVVADPGGAITLDPPRWCGHSTDPGSYMTGAFDSIRVWNRALSADEIASVAGGDASCFALP